MKFFRFLLIIGISAIHTPSHVLGSSEEMEFYDSCEHRTGTICHGIPTDHDCIAAKDCDYAASLRDSEGSIWVDTLAENPKPYAVVVGFAPYQKIGTDMKAKCKDKLDLMDFRFIFYKLGPKEIGGITKNSEVEGDSGSGVAKEGWFRTQECDGKSFARANGWLPLGPNIVDHLTLGGEYIHLYGGANIHGKDPLKSQLPGFKDTTKYNSKDGIIYKNF